MRTIGEMLRNNWNSINDAKPKERAYRIAVQNRFSNTGEFDIDSYVWNDETEKKFRSLYAKGPPKIKEAGPNEEENIL